MLLKGHGLRDDLGRLLVEVLNQVLVLVLQTKRTSSG
jgi:hypothetical protein